MPRRVQGVPPRVKDEMRYYRWTRLNILIPLFDAFGNDFTSAPNAAAAFITLDRIPLQIPMTTRDEVRSILSDMDGYHRRRFIQTFRNGAQIDVRPFITRPEVDAFLSRKVEENVALIRTIPERTRDGLADRLRGELRTAPFDQERLTNLLREEYRSEGYNLRRITRDQTNKTVGQLSEIRQRQLGISRYTWRTAQDERVRPTHAANANMGFEWSRPPPLTGHPGNDIQCRCIALPILDI